MRETITGVQRLPDAKYTFIVVGVPEKIKLDSGHTKRIWTLQYYEGNEKKQKKLHLFPSDYAPIVLAIGGKKKGADVDWDDEEVDGKAFSCDLKSVKSKDGKYENYRFENCEETVPF